MPEALRCAAMRCEVVATMECAARIDHTARNPVLRRFCYRCLIAESKETSCGMGRRWPRWMSRMSTAPTTPVSSSMQGLSGQRTDPCRAVVGSIAPTWRLGGRPRHEFTRTSDPLQVVQTVRLCFKQCPAFQQWSNCGEEEKEAGNTTAPSGHPRHSAYSSLATHIHSHIDACILDADRLLVPQ